MCVWMCGGCVQMSVNVWWLCANECGCVVVVGCGFFLVREAGISIEYIHSISEVCKTSHDKSLHCVSRSQLGD